MTYIPRYIKSYHIDLHLTTTDKKIQNLIDNILDEISTIKKITNRPRSREALKKLLLNLIEVKKKDGRLRISRNKNNYSHHKMYRGPWLSFKWFIEIAMDGLLELGYIEHLKGYWDKEKNRGYQTKIWASDKLLDRLRLGILSQCERRIQRTEPEQIIQLKDSDKKLFPYVRTKSINEMKKRLEQYNNFISGQYITVNLTEPVIADNEFWINNLYQGFLNGSYTLDGLKLNQEIYPMDTGEDKANSTRHSDSGVSSNSRDIILPCKSDSTHSPIITNTHTTTTTPPTTSTKIYRVCPYQPILPSTLISHIHFLKHLSSTQENRSNPLIDGAFMISEQQLQEYFLNWLLFKRLELRSGTDYAGMRRRYQVRNTLGKLGMSELVFRLKYESLHRVFNDKSFKRGGRFYGAAHLDIPNYMRGFIHINGEPVVELDYDALHIVMLYHLGKLDIDLNQDPYEMIPGPEDRTIKKTVLLTAINAPSDIKAIKGIRKKLIDDGIREDVLKDESLKSLLSRAKLAHPDIADDIASGRGIELQNTDSKIAEAILINFMEMGVPALCVHDSFIVPAQYEDELRRQMVEEYEKILKFKPGVSKKEKRYEPKKINFYK